MPTNGQQVFRIVNLDDALGALPEARDATPAAHLDSECARAIGQHRFDGMLLRWTPFDRRPRKRLATRQGISDVATRFATWTVAFLDGHRTFRQSRDMAAADTAFLLIVDRGTIAVKAAVAGTPYG